MTNRFDINAAIELAQETAYGADPEEYQAILDRTLADVCGDDDDLWEAANIAMNTRMMRAAGII